MFSGKWLYIGNDEVMQEVITLHTQNTVLHSMSKDLEVERIDYDKNEWSTQFIDKVAKNVPDIIFFDFQPLNLDDQRIKQFLMQCNVLKRNSDCKQILIVAIFKDKEQSNRLQFIFCEGINYSFIKKVEQEQALIDVMYFRYQDLRLRYPIYALAHKMNIPHTFFEIGKIMYFRDGMITIDCDKEFTIGSNDRVHMNLFDDFKCKEFEVIDVKEIGNFQYYNHSVDLQIKFPSPWEDIAEDSIDERTFKTWLEHNIEDHTMLASMMSAMVIGEERDLLREFALVAKDLPCLHYYTSLFNEASSLITQHRPDLITVCAPHIEGQSSKATKEATAAEQQEGEGEEISFEQVEFRTQIHHLINEIRRVEGYFPYIIYFTEEKDGMLLKEHFQYANLLPVQHRFDATFYLKLLEKIDDKVSTKKEEKTYHPYPHDPRKIVEIPREVIITGLTEHEITFLCEEELPLFSQFKLYFPYPVLLTMIPPTRELPFVPKYRHQMAVFHAMSEEDLSLMRRFVNFIIYQPVEKFYFDPKTMVVPEDEGMIETAPKKGLEVAGVTAKNRHTIKYHTVDRGRNKGKAKL